MMVGAVAVATSTTFGVYAWQDFQDQQADQVEQSPGRAAASTTSTYIVRLEENPVVKYRGGNPRFRATAPPRGQKLNPNDPAVMSNASYLDGTHDVALRAVGGGRKLYDYRYAVNGFTAVLTPAQAAQLAQTPGVASVEPDAAVPLSTVSTRRFSASTRPGDCGIRWAASNAPAKTSSSAWSTAACGRNIPASPTARAATATAGQAS